MSVLRWPLNADMDVPKSLVRRRRIKMQSAYLQFKLWSFHPQDIRDEKVSSALAHWEHGECSGIANQSIPQIFHGSNGFLAELEFFISPRSQCSRAELTFFDSGVWGVKEHRK